MVANWQGREGLSADCNLSPEIVVMILLAGQEHPCDRCNMDREECRGFDRLGMQCEAAAAEGE